MGAVGEAEIFALSFKSLSSFSPLSSNYLLPFPPDPQTLIVLLSYCWMVQYRRQRFQARRRNAEQTGKAEEEEAAGGRHLRKLPPELLLGSETMEGKHPFKRVTFDLTGYNVPVTVTSIQTHRVILSFHWPMAQCIPDFFFQKVIYSLLPLMLRFSQNQMHSLLPGFPRHQIIGLLRKKGNDSFSGPLTLWAHTSLTNLIRTFRPQDHGQEAQLVYPERKKKSHSQGHLFLSWLEVSATRASLLACSLC